MTPARSRVWVLGFCTALLAVCSDDPAPTAPTPTPPPSPAEEPPAADRVALIAFYNATGGPQWHEQKNWNTTESISNWHGVSTNLAGFVTGLSLPGNNLSGALPPELGDLTHLGMARSGRQRSDGSNSGLNSAIWQS